MIIKLSIPLMCLVLFTISISTAESENSGIYSQMEDTLGSHTDFSFWSLGCDPSITRTEAVFSMDDSLYVSLAIVDSLHDTLYSFGTNRFPPGQYKVIWQFSDHKRDSLPVILWIELLAKVGTTGSSSKYSARAPFCVP